MRHLLVCLGVVQCFSEWQRLPLAAENAGRTAVVLSGLHAVSTTTAVVGAGATGYSIGARLNGAVQAAYRTFQEGH